MTTTERRIPSQLPKFFYEIADRRYFRESKILRKTREEGRAYDELRGRMLRPEYLEVLREVCEHHGIELID